MHERSHQQEQRQRRWERETDLGNFERGAIVLAEAGNTGTTRRPVRLDARQLHASYHRPAIESAIDDLTSIPNFYHGSVINPVCIWHEIIVDKMYALSCVAEMPDRILMAKHHSLRQARLVSFRPPSQARTRPAQ